MRLFRKKDFQQAALHFSRVYRPEVPTKFFLRWLWRMTAHLELGNVWLQAGGIAQAKSVSVSFLESALTTADPQLRALAWDLRARVSLAEQNITLAREQIENGLAVVEMYEVPMATWQVCATASEIYRNGKDDARAEPLMAKAQDAIMKIANSFSPGEPLRANFLAAEPVRRVLQHGTRPRIARQALVGQKVLH